MPFTVSKCGVVLAVIVFAIATIVTQLGSILLLKAKNLSGHSNFSTIFYHIYQNKLCKGLGSILIFFNNLGICMIKDMHRYPRNHHFQDHDSINPRGNPPWECSARWVLYEWDIHCLVDIPYGSALHLGQEDREIEVYGLFRSKWNHGFRYYLHCLLHCQTCQLLSNPHQPWYGPFPDRLVVGYCINPHSPPRTFLPYELLPSL